MARKHPAKHSGKDFMLGAMIGSTVGAISALLFTTKKGSKLKHHAVEKFHDLEHFVKDMWHKKGKAMLTAGKRKKRTKTKRKK